MVNLIEVKQKICMIGDAAVGKTSLIRRFVLDQFSDDYIATFGMKVIKKRIKYNAEDDNIIDLSMIIWDIMGQEQFKKAQMAGYADSKGAFIVCDVTRKETLENIITWYSDIQSVAHEIPVVVMANKNDLLSQAKFSQHDLNDVSKQINAPSYFTSAKTGENVEVAFRELGKVLIKQKVPIPLIEE
jgi:small GTP-binding protein